MTLIRVNETNRIAWLAGKLPFDKAPKDDRGLPDIHLALYNDVVVFDQATKLAYVISWAHLDGLQTPALPSKPLSKGFCASVLACLLLEPLGFQQDRCAPHNPI